MTLERREKERVVKEKDRVIAELQSLVQELQSQVNENAFASKWLAGCYDTLFGANVGTHEGKAVHFAKVFSAFRSKWAPEWERIILRNANTNSSEFLKEPASTFL